MHMIDNNNARVPLRGFTFLSNVVQVEIKRPFWIAFSLPINARLGAQLLYENEFLFTCK